jgi:hypothetical protein
MSNEKSLCFVSEYDIKSILDIENDILDWIESEKFPRDKNGLVKGNFILNFEFVKEGSK